MLLTFKKSLMGALLCGFSATGCACNLDNKEFCPNMEHDIFKVTHGDPFQSPEGFWDYVKAAIDLGSTQRTVKVLQKSYHQQSEFVPEIEGMYVTQASGFSLYLRRGWSACFEVPSKQKCKITLWSGEGGASGVGVRSEGEFSERISDLEEDYGKPVFAGKDGYPGDMNGAFCRVCD